MPVTRPLPALKGCKVGRMTIVQTLTAAAVALMPEPLVADTS